MSDDQWLLDSISGFLSSPGWALPVMSFIDENCVVFDDEDESQLAYTDIYGAFKEMVDMLLEMHLDAMGVTVDQFVSVVQKLAHTEAGRETLQQLLAVDDYVSFEKMMVKRNRELELEALKALESLSRQSAAAADAGAPVAEAGEAGEVGEEEAMLQAAIKASMAEAGFAVGAAEVAAKQIEKEEADLRMAIALSLQIQQEIEERVEAEAPSEPELEPLEAKPAPARAELQERLSKATRSMEASSERSHAILPLKKREAPADSTPDEAPKPAGQASLAGLPPLKAVSLQEVRATEAMARAAEARVRAEEDRERTRKAVAGAAAGSDVGKIAGQEMEARAAHLRKQRDVILTQRKREREKAAAAEPARPAPPAPPAAAPALDSTRAGLSRQLAAGMKAQLGGDPLGLGQLDARKADLEATKAALKAEFAANRS